MIKSLTEEQFNSLPEISFCGRCDKCNKVFLCCYLYQSLSNHIVKDGDIKDKKGKSYIAAYLCEDCYAIEENICIAIKAAQIDILFEQQENEAIILKNVSKIPISELAEKIGVCRQSFHRWTKGKSITYKNMVKIIELIEEYTK